MAATSTSIERQHACYEQLIADYARFREQCPDIHLDYCLAQPNLAATIEAAAQAVDEQQKIHSHQRRIGRRRLREWAEHLVAYGEDIEPAASFEDLLAVVEKAAREFPGGGVGELTIYDTAHRIGVCLRKLPTQVHLHSGTREGAAVIVEGLTRDTQSIALTQLPAPFQQLAAADVEDILCIYKKQLQECKNTVTCSLPPKNGCC